jgi:hypothetical protein
LKQAGKLTKDEWESILQAYGVRESMQLLWPPPQTRQRPHRFDRRRRDQHTRQRGARVLEL